MEEKRVGEKIRSLRERKAWTQERLADIAGVSARTVQRAEEGVMAAETRASIATALGVPVESLALGKKPPHGWPRISVAVFYDDSKTAVAWLQEAFGFHVREMVTGTDGQVLHSELVFEDGVIMVGHASSSPRWASPKSIGKVTQGLYVFVNDLDTHFARARKAGAKILSEPETSYGQRRYRALDLEGHEWCFAVEAEQQ